MKLNCSKCSHHWDEDPSVGTGMVQCPECFAVMPLVLAGKSSGDEPSPTIHSAKTMVQAELLAEEPPRPREGRSASRSQTPVTPFEETGITDGGDVPPRRDPHSFAAGVSDDKTGVLEPNAGGEAQVVGNPPAPAGKLRPSTTGDFHQAMPKEIDLSGKTVGGYVVRKMLGAGGMGAVCLARQMSLDRDVALKILPGRLAGNPEFLARFTREALSAAQLSHHNIIQVFDVGSDSDIHYISMEYVRGDNLGNMVREDGKLAIDDACGYVLQAARGLKYAHDRGIIHRDIKPDNIMVNEHGVVKIADMGLAKMRGEAEATRLDMESGPGALRQAKGDITLHDVAMGTPAYMAPEQARDASSVDHRADEYSLGCTLYYLVAGKAPYSGSSAFEIISKHQTEPPPPLESYVRNVPPALSDILKRMLAKDPGDRYPTLVEVIRELEAFLGVGAEKGPYTPREHHMAVLETEQKNYDSAPTARMRKLVVAGFAGGISVLILGALFSGYPVLAGGLLGLGLMTPLAGFILDGILHKRHLFRRVRSVFFGMTLRGWAATAGSAAIMLGILYVLGLLWHWLIFAVLAAGLAAAYQLRVVRRLDAERAPAIASTLEMLKQLRLRGVPEEAMQDFVCRFSSEQWEEFFEELFGYEAMVLARGKWAAADKVHPRKKFSTWRDPVARALDGVEQHRKAAREKHQLAKVEAKRLRAQGVTEKEAELQAQEAATKILSDIRITHAAPAKDVPVPKARPRHTSEKTVLDRAFQVARFLLGAAMCVGFAAFLFQNISVAAVRPILQVVNQLPMPEGVMRVLHSYYGLGAGVALILSSFSGRRIGPVLVTAGAVLMVGFQFIVPLISRFHVVTGQAAIYAAVGLIVAGLGWSLLGKLTTGRF